MAVRSQTPPVAQLATELGECRQRGLDRLDVNTGPQTPVTAPVLDQLAREYRARAAPQVHGRVAAIKHLLHDALTAYSQAGNGVEAELITELLFPDPATSPPPNPGVMLKQAMQRRGVTDEKKFRDDRRRTFVSFAEFLLTFTRETTRTPPRRRHAVLATIGVLLLLAAAAAIWLSTRHSPQTAGNSGAATTTGQMTTTTNPPPAPGSTHPETVNAGVGARTYRNPHSLTGEGQRIDNRRTVQVSCKIAVPNGAPSAGLYWYRIADPPWNNQYYSPANSYLNGDPTNGPYTHEIDLAVPDCAP